MAQALWCTGLVALQHVGSSRSGIEHMSSALPLGHQGSLIIVILLLNLLPLSWFCFPTGNHWFILYICESGFFLAIVVIFFSLFYFIDSAYQ